MVNFGFNSASILGIFLAVAGGGLYLLRSLRPEVSRDHDIFFAAVGLLCGGILLWHGWRLDPILQFCQLLLAGSAVFFAGETVRLRGATGQQARRGSSYVEDERPSPSRVYRAELDRMDGYEDEYEEETLQRRRLQGTPSRNTTRRSASVEEGRAPRRRPPNRGGYDQAPSRNAPTRGGYDDRWDDNPDAWDDNPPRRNPQRPPSSRPSRDEYTQRPPSSRPPRRPKSPEDIVSSMGTEYVDYQPLEDNSPSDQS